MYVLTGYVSLGASSICAAETIDNEFEIGCCMYLFVSSSRRAKRLFGALHGSHEAVPQFVLCVSASSGGGSSGTCCACPNHRILIVVTRTLRGVPRVSPYSFYRGLGNYFLTALSTKVKGAGETSAWKPPLDKITFCFTGAFK